LISSSYSERLCQSESPSGPRFDLGDLQGVTRHIRVEADRTLGDCLGEVEPNR
jgi:hypothetical protein